MTHDDSRLLGARPVEINDGVLTLIDQRRLPFALEYFRVDDFASLIYAIKEMVVRGAPAIGLAAAWGLALEIGRSEPNGTLIECLRRELIDARPTAVNLRFAADAVASAALSALPDSVSARSAALAAASDLERSLLDANLALSKAGAALIDDGACVLTHCNAGPLATAGYGTALGAIRLAHHGGKKLSVLVDETRPRNQGARLTMYELMGDGIDCHLIADNMSGFFMARGDISMVITGADRIALNGDVANKIGTYNLAVLARHHGIPFYVAAPLSTFDLELSSGMGIPIEYRAVSELLTLDGADHTPAGARALNPAFDITPGTLVTGIVSELGVHTPPYDFAHLKSMYSMA